MTIVLTNDDGVGARGLMTMRAALERAGLATVVVAPENNQSGVSRAASYTNPVRVHRCDDGPLPVYAVAGTPVDCVRIALGALAPDAALVISGINHGGNIGDDMLNSGTVGAAVEAALFGVPAIAISQQAVPGHLAIVEPPDAPFTDFAHSARVAVALARAVRDRPPRGRAIINVNVPAQQADRLCVTRLGKRFNLPGSLAPVAESGSAAYYQVYGTHQDPPSCELSDGTDFAALRDGVVGVTPVSYEQEPGHAAELVDWANDIVDAANPRLSRAGTHESAHTGSTG